MPLKLTATRLKCQRGERLLLDDFSFSVLAGEMVVLTGPNGVGKSSLLRILAGLLEAQEGKVEIISESKDDANLIYYLGHRDALREALTVVEALAFVQSLLGKGHRGVSIERAVEKLKIEHLLLLPIGVLSAGQKRRVALAGLLCAGRPIWLLDEPTTALDADGQALAAGLFAGHCAAGGMIIAATHLPLGTETREVRLGQPHSLDAVSAAG